MAQQLDTIFGKAGDTAVDPVCEMVVDKTRPPGGTAGHDGTTYYRCSTGCQHAFVEDPAKYL